MKILAFLTDPPVLSAILLHLDLPHRPPPLSPARGPPQPDFLLDQSSGFDPADPEPSSPPEKTSTPCRSSVRNLPCPSVQQGFSITYPPTLAVSCPFCMAMLEDGLKAQEGFEEHPVKARHVVEIVADAIP